MQDLAKNPGSEETVISKLSVEESGAVVTDAENSIEGADQEPEPGNDAVKDDKGKNESGEGDVSIKLKIAEGPIYSEADDVCYYRLEAIVLGDPQPQVTFSKDDSNGAWGKYMAQVNLTRNSPSYLLTATAKNAEGQATTFIELIWGCGGDAAQIPSNDDGENQQAGVDNGGINSAPELGNINTSDPSLVVSSYCELSIDAADADGDQLFYTWSVSGGALAENSLSKVAWKTPGSEGEYTISVSVSDGINPKVTRTKVITVNSKPMVSKVLHCVVAEGGFVEKDADNPGSGSSIFAGDSGSDRACCGFMSFDISQLAGAKIKTANAIFNVSKVLGDPRFMAVLVVTDYYYGPRPIEDSDYDGAGQTLYLIQSNENPTFSFNNDALKNSLQNAINIGRPRYQMKIQFIGNINGLETDNDEECDGWDYEQKKGVRIFITYVPGS